MDKGRILAGWIVPSGVVIAGFILLTRRLKKSSELDMQDHERLVNSVGDRLDSIHQELAGVVKQLTVVTEPLRSVRRGVKEPRSSSGPAF